MLKDKDIGYILHKVSMLAKNNFSNKLNTFGITIVQFSVIKEIYYYQTNTDGALGLSPACIADRLESDRPTITGVIDRLESQGWVDKFKNPDDRRSVLIKVTDKAIGRLAELEKMRYESINNIINGFTEEEINTLRNYLFRIENNLKNVQ